MSTTIDFLDNLIAEREQQIAVLMKEITVLRHAYLSIANGTKLCPRCQKLFPATPAYFATAMLGSGLSSYCRVCMQAYSAERKQKHQAQP